MRKPEIILPKRIAVLRELPNQDIRVKHEEFHLYYENFIYPLYPWHNIVIDCKYGSNFTRCWKLSQYPSDVDEFPLTVKVYDEDGQLEASAETVIELYDKDVTEPFKLLCVGDSMTHRMVYPAHLQNKLKNVFTCGTMTADGHVFSEGRGGWTLERYLNVHALAEGERGPTQWVSPFLFPKSISGKAYFGDMEFYKASREPNRSTYCFADAIVPDPEDGQYYHQHGKLYASDGTLVSETVEWEFNFRKYLAKNDIQNLNAVSLFFGANDMYPWGHYEDIPRLLEQFIGNMKFFIQKIKEADPKIDVIINLPLPSSSQDAFATRYGCQMTDKEYRASMRAASKAILQEFEGKDGISICPMSHVIDTVSGFDSAAMRESLYCDKQYTIAADPVHPNVTGYRQIGDALAGAVEKLRHKK